MRLIPARIRRVRRSGDEGAGLVLVMGFMTIVLGMVTVSVTVTINSLGSSRSHVKFEQAIDVAESGVDQMLARLQKNTAYYTAGVVARDFATADEERTWAKQQVANLVALGQVQTVPGGEFVAFKPQNTATATSNTVYSMGWVPSRTDPKAKQRLIKTEYLFAPYKPAEAILTGSNLDLSGSVALSATSGAPSGVHSNGDISSRSSDTIAGPVTASGTYDGAANVSNDPDNLTGSQTPLETIPAIDPRYIYDTQIASYANSWYDLCPDGTVRQPASTGPCTASATMASLSGGGTFRGWSYVPQSGSTAATWTMGMPDSPYAGVYYVYQGDAVVNGQTSNGGAAWNASVIAEARQNGSSDAASCNKLGGNVTWKLSDISAFMPGVVMIAGADLYDTANNTAGSGIFGAADQVHLQTSSAQLTGVIIAGDQCRSGSDSNEVQGVTLHFDETGEIPLQSVVRTTLWLEYVG